MDVWIFQKQLKVMEARLGPLNTRTLEKLDREKGKKKITTRVPEFLQVSQRFFKKENNNNHCLSMFKLLMSSPICFQIPPKRCILVLFYSKKPTSPGYSSWSSHYPQTCFGFFLKSKGQNVECNTLELSSAFAIATQGLISNPTGRCFEVSGTYCFKLCPPGQ